MHKIITSKKGSNEFEKNEEKCMGRFEEGEREWINVIIISKKAKTFYFHLNAFFLFCFILFTILYFTKLPYLYWNLF